MMRCQVVVKEWESSDYGYLNGFRVKVWVSFFFFAIHLDSLDSLMVAIIEVVEEC